MTALTPAHAAAGANSCTSDGAKMTTWTGPRNSTNTPAQSPCARGKDGYPRSLRSASAVRDGQAVFTWPPSASGSSATAAPTAGPSPALRGRSLQSCEDYWAISAAPALIGWDIADLYPARIALIRATLRRNRQQLTMGTQISRTRQVQVDSARPTRKRDQHRRRHGPRPHHRRQDRVPSGVSTGTSGRSKQNARLLCQRAFPRSASSATLSGRTAGRGILPVPSHTRHKPIFHAPARLQKLPRRSGVDGAPSTTAAPLAARAAPKRRPYLPGAGVSPPLAASSAVNATLRAVSV